MLWKFSSTTRAVCLKEHNVLLISRSSRILRRSYAVKTVVRGGADKSLALQRRKQATATKVRIYSTYSPRRSIHFFACCSNFCKPLKKKSEGCPSNQVSAAAMTSASEKNGEFSIFFQSRKQVVVDGARSGE